MLALGVVVAAMAGVPFTNVASDVSLPDAWLKYLGDPPGKLGVYYLAKMALVPTWPWPLHMVTALGPDGLQLLDGLLTYEPMRRGTAAA